MHVLASRPSPRRRLTQLVSCWISTVSSSACFFHAVNCDTHSRNFILNNARAYWLPSKLGDEILLPAGNKADVTVFEISRLGISERERESRCQGIIIRCSVIVVDSRLVWPRWEATLVKKGLISAAAVFGIATAAHAGELSDIQEQSRQLREQNQALTKRTGDLERRQRKLEAQPVAKQPADSMAPTIPFTRRSTRRFRLQTTA
jgi:hypothetical protein